jgi:hypothetical protein
MVLVINSRPSVDNGRVQDASSFAVITCEVIDLQEILLHLVRSSLSVLSGVFMKVVLNEIWTEPKSSYNRVLNLPLPK